MKRPRFTPMRILLIAAAFPVLLSAIVVTRYAFATPDPSVDYAERFNELALSVQPGAETQPNRIDGLAALLEKAAALRAPYQTSENFLNIDVLAVRGPAEFPTPEGVDKNAHYEQQRRLALEYIDRLDSSGIFEELRTLPDIQHAYDPVPPGTDISPGRMLPTRSLNTIGLFQELAIELKAISIHLGRQGETDRAIDLFEQTMALGRIASYTPTLISGLVALSIETVAYNAMTTLAREHRFTDSQLDRIARMTRSRRSAPMEHTIAGERLMIDDMLQRMYTDNGAGDGIIAMSAWSGIGFSRTMFEDAPKYDAFNFLGLALPTRKRMVEAIDAYEQHTLNAMSDPTIVAKDLDSFNEHGETIMEVPIITPGTRYTRQTRPKRPRAGRLPTRLHHNTRPRTPPQRSQRVPGLAQRPRPRVPRRTPRRPLQPRQPPHLPPANAAGRTLHPLLLRTGQRRRQRSGRRPRLRLARQVIANASPLSTSGGLGKARGEGSPNSPSSNPSASEASPTDA